MLLQLVDGFPGRQLEVFHKLKRLRAFDLSSVFLNLLVSIKAGLGFNKLVHVI